MIQHPLLIVAFLLSIEILIFYLAEHPRYKRFFRFLPFVFWIYFLPMLSSSLGLIDAKSPVYQQIIKHFLPASLLLLLIPVDIKAIVRLGPMALIMFFAGSLGIMIGTVAVFAVFKPWVGPQFWSGFGALSGSWTGGSANMIAVKEAIETPEKVFAPMVVVDTIVPYVWMGFLVAMSGAQAIFDRANRSDRTVLDDLSERIRGVQASKVEKSHWRITLALLAGALIASQVVQFAAQYFPVIKNAISTMAWTIILITLLGISLSFTKARELENYGSDRIGYFLLYFVLTAIGARASLGDLQATFMLLVAGMFIVIFHAVVLALTARLLKAPMFLMAVASQANVGGVASTPIVAEIYQPGLASVGLLLAILGNIAGTYLGIITAQVCRWVAGG